MALLTPQEAARELAISYKQLLALTTSGQIKYVNVGNGLKREWRRYTEEDLKEFIERRKRQECQSTKNVRASRTATISSSKAIDFLARRDARIKDRLKSSKKPSGKE